MDNFGYELDDTLKDQDVYYCEECLENSNYRNFYDDDDGDCQNEKCYLYKHKQSQHTSTRSL